MPKPPKTRGNSPEDHLLGFLDRDLVPLEKARELAIICGRDDPEASEADAAFEQLRMRGIARCLVNIGGDIRVGDPPPGKAGWRVVPVPFSDGSDGNRGEAMIVSNLGVASSCDAERSVEVAGVRY